jgi:hypothetical protein
MADLQKLFENYLKSSYRTTPVRSPFSQANYYSGGKVGGEIWQEITDLYNTTYRTHHEEDGFDRVMYNEAINAMVMFPKEDAEAFSKIEEGEAVLQLGLKAARGFKKDYRFLDQSIPGAGKYAISEEDAERLIDEPFEILREIQPEYTRNFGETPVEPINEQVQKNLHKLIREEVDRIVSLTGEIDLGLSKRENKAARNALRKLQLNHDLPKYIDAMADNAAEKLRKGNPVTNPEKDLILKAANKA